MRIGRLTILLSAFCGAFWIGLAAQVPQQINQAEPARIDLPLAAAGAPTPTGLNVTRGDRLRFEARPADDNSPALMANFPPSFTGRIGRETFPIAPGQEVIAPASGALNVAVSFPDQIPQSRWPGVVIRIEHEPQAVEIAQPPEVNNNVVGNAAGNEVGNGIEGNQVEELVPPPANGVTAAVPPDPPPPDAPPPSQGPDWTVIALAAAAAGVALATAIALSRGTKPAPPAAAPPALAISPSLDMSQGEASGDPISLAGPEIRLRGALEPGDTFFEGEGPVVEREERDG